MKKISEWVSGGMPILAVHTDTLFLVSPSRPHPIILHCPLVTYLVTSVTCEAFMPVFGDIVGIILFHLVAE
jgi:hypothetical protein